MLCHLHENCKHWNWATTGRVCNLFFRDNCDIKKASYENIRGDKDCYGSGKLDKTYEA